MRNRRRRTKIAKQLGAAVRRRRTRRRQQDVRASALGVGGEENDEHAVKTPRAITPRPVVPTSDTSSR
jgi:hypothetical protein